MQNFRDGFYENRGWLGLMQQNPTTLALEVGGTAISNTYTIATMPDAASVEPGSIINIPRSEFTTSTAAEVPGMPEDGIYLRASDGEWIPAYTQVFSQAYGTKASPLVAVAATGAVAIHSIVLPSGNPIIPWEIYGRVGFKFRMQAWVGHTSVSAVASTFSAHFGWSATYSDNAMIENLALPVGTDKMIEMNTLGVITAYASAASNNVSGNSTLPNSVGGITTTGIVDRANAMDFTKDAYFSFAIDPAAGGETNTEALYWYRIILEP